MFLDLSTHQILKQMGSPENNKILRKEGRERLSM
jgi:hypothetical protein